MLMWMGPLGSALVVLGFLFIAKELKKFDIIKGHIELFAKGNISNSIDEELIKRKDEVGDIAKSILTMQKNQIKIVTEIKNAATNILNAGNQLKSVSMQISERTGEQASTTEEIASSMEEMVATINSNTEKAILTESIFNKIGNRNEKK